MNYDLDFRYRRALQPDALATIATATQAVVDAMQDARNAGIDPARDPATILLARHVGRIALGHAPDETFAEDLPLRRQCLAKIDELKSKPALVALARRGIGYDPEAKRAFRGNESALMRRSGDKSSITADTPVPYRIADLLALIDERIGWRDYNGLGTVLLTLFVAVLIIENLSQFLRSKLS